MYILRFVSSPERRRFCSCIALFFVLPVLLFAQDKRPLSHDDVGDWDMISTSTISNNGAWTLWQVGPDGKDQRLHVRGGENDTTWTIERAEKARFTASSEFMVFQRVPAVDSVRALKLAETDTSDLPEDSLGVLHLASGVVTLLAANARFELPEEGDSWIAYLIDFPEADSSDTSDAGTEGSDEKAPGKNESEEDQKRLVILNLTTWDESSVSAVLDFAFSKTGNLLVYTRTVEPDSISGLFAIRPGQEIEIPIMSRAGSISEFVIDEEGSQVAFIYNPQDDDDVATDAGLFLSDITKGESRQIASKNNPAFEEGWWISDKRKPSFSKSGNRIYFGTAPPPLPAINDTTMLQEERMDLDIWAWTDPLLQPQQIKRAESETDRTYLAMYDRMADRLVQLASVLVPDVTVADEGDGSFALGRSTLPYLMLSSWDSPRYYDAYGVNVMTGEKILLLNKIQDTPRLSPGGKYIYWWDRDSLVWRTRGMEDDIETNVTRLITLRLDNELHDWPYKPNSYGDAGWTDNDEWFLLYDKYDIWAVDPIADRAPVNITNGKGRETDTRYRIIRTDSESPTMNADKDLLLSSFHFGSKKAGFSTDRVRGETPPFDFLLSEHRYSTPEKAKDADFYLYTRESYADFPDVWISDTKFKKPRRLSFENPQQSQFSWGSVEPVSWTSVDGEKLEGMLFKPDEFDPNRKYPMVVNFYEKNSESLFRHRRPYFHRSTLNYTYYVSRGYLIFVPDIPYKVGYPGESAMNAVMPGISALIDKGFVDRHRIGAMGHSWGGYQIAYMVTQTNLFAAAVAGAPVSNMTSAYGGIRWGSGMSRMFQYERTQSRIGGSLWEYPLRYIHNSPIFQADKIETPLMWQHNDHDGAVPWYQGIELFVALRRLQKPAWMLNYNGADHWVQKLHRRKDFNIRMQQFFDHYLKGVPAPEWMVAGIPGVMKNRTLGLELSGQ